MFDMLRIRLNQGDQAVPDIKKAVLPEIFRGFPLLDTSKCKKGCSACKDICCVNAIEINPLKIDIGKCNFCGECERVCNTGAIKFSNFHKTASLTRERLIIDGSIGIDKYLIDSNEVDKKIKRLFKRSLKIRSVSAGGCNACEYELNACNNVNFDMSRFGFDIVASPRHADCIVITGPISCNMSSALEDAYNSTPDPKLIILAGSCAISGGLFAESLEISREFLKKYKIDLFVPGCPPHPLSIINGILGLLGV